MTQISEKLSTALAGRYRIERRLGEGGMATVYLAEDVKHDRKVAVKVLRPELAAVLGAERFVQEIKTTAGMQHPHILPLHDSGEAGSFLYYVMPYIDGETLRDKLDRETQLGVDEAVKITTEVADALDYAHRNNVIHRDIKPENILLHDGRPMVADFGIALAVSAAAGGRMTETGLSLGTPYYMSPEQATADKDLTNRSDIYSLGAMLYEMLTGDPPHTGSSAQQIIMKIVTEDAPPITKMRKSVPPNVAAAVARALEKLPADRFDSAKAFADALVDPTFAIVRTTAAHAAVRADGVSRRAFAAVVALAAVATGIAAWSWFQPGPAAQDWVSTFTVQLPDSVKMIRPVGSVRLALSRDGSQLAFAGTGVRGQGAIWIRNRDDLHARLVAGTENGIAPVYSPDGSWLLFVNRATRQLMKVPVGGGSPSVVADDVGVRSAPSWGDPDTILFVKEGQVWRVSPDGGDPAPLVRSDSAVRVLSPTLLPGGAHVLVVVDESRSVGVMSVPDGAVTELDIGQASNPRYAPSGHLLYGRADGALFAVPFSLSRTRVTGEAVRLVQGVNRTLGQLEFDVAEDGTLAYVSASATTTIVAAVDRAGAERVLTAEPRQLGFPRISPDGRRIVFEVAQPGQVGWDLWIYDLSSQTFTRLTTDNTGLRPGGWSSDGRRVAFLRRQPDSPGLGVIGAAWIAADGSGGPESLLAPDGLTSNVTVSATGGYVAVSRGYPAPGGDTDIWLAAGGPGAVPEAFVATSAVEVTPHLSSDGRLLAYASNETGRFEVYVRQTVGGGRLQVSAGGGREPVWVPGEYELFYRGPQRMMTATVSGAVDMTVIRRDTLFESEYFASGANTMYDVFPGGDELVMIRSAEGSELVMVLNWPARLRNGGG